MTNDFRNDFPLIAKSSVAYLDNAATAQRPQCVLDAENDFYLNHNANPLRGLYPLSVEATEIYENAREAVRAFLNARSAEEIIFTRNTTDSLNLVAYSYGLSHVKAGDEVLVSIMEHHSDLNQRGSVRNCGIGCISGASSGTAQSTSGNIKLQGKATGMDREGAHRCRIL